MDVGDAVVVEVAVPNYWKPTIRTRTLSVSLH